MHFKQEISMISVDLLDFVELGDFGAVCANSDKGPAPPAAARGRAPAALARGCRGGVVVNFPFRTCERGERASLVKRSSLYS